MVISKHNQSAEVIKHSVGPNGIPVITLRLKVNRFILGELLRHRVLSPNVASSRAIPYAKQREQVMNNPVVPTRFLCAHKGMQGNDYLNVEETLESEDIWMMAGQEAVQHADLLDRVGVTKQLTNRLLEPFMTSTVVVTSTEWDSVMILRHPHHIEDGKVIWEDKVNLDFPAEIHIQELAILIRSSIEHSTPEKLEEGGWHLPFVSKTEEEIALVGRIAGSDLHPDTLVQQEMLYCSLSAARVAMTSYDINEGKSLESELALAGRLIENKHGSTLEQQVRALPYPCEEDKWPVGITHSTRDGTLYSNNTRGWIQHRALLEV